MLRKFLEEIADKGYVINFHYSPESRELSISMTKLDGRVKFNTITLPASYLSDDEGLVMEMRKLAAMLEEK